MQQVRADLIETLHAHLRGNANAGGWPYQAGKSSRIEPTCWALFALAGVDAAGLSENTATDVSQHLAYLRSLQASTGFLVETDPSLVNIAANAMALIALRALGGSEYSDSAQRLETALVSLKGVRLAEPDAKQDNTLQGWPWVRDTFSWVEPTAWVLLALKLETRAVGAVAREARQTEAERLLLNRMCVGGGWNYGNASTLGQDLRAYVPTTAVALMALQNHRDGASVRQSLKTLIEQRVSERGSMSLALASLCLNLYGAPVDSLDDALMIAAERSVSTGNVLAVAMALFALSFARHQGGVFRVT